MAQQMPTAEDVLEESEEDLNRPAIAVDQGNDLCRHVQQVRRNPQHAVTAGPGRTPFVLAAFDVRRCLDRDQPNRMIGPRVSFARLAQSDSRVFQDARSLSFSRERMIYNGLGFLDH